MAGGNTYQNVIGALTFALAFYVTGVVIMAAVAACHGVGRILINVGVKAPMATGYLASGGLCASGGAGVTDRCSMVRW